MYSRFVPLALFANLVSSSPFNSLPARDTVECSGDYAVCSPEGASTSHLPSVGPALAPLYTSLLDSIAGIHFGNRNLLRRNQSPNLRPYIESHLLARRDSSGPSICCAQTTECVNLNNFNVPFCYDKFTTNYILADGATGNLHSGSFTASDGTQIDLFTGAWSGGNIYSGSSSTYLPNTATMSIPPQWTGTGVGSAIPITQLGSIVVVTTTLEGHTYEPTTTVAASTISVVISHDGTALTTQAISTVPAITVTEETTLDATTAVMSVTVSKETTATESVSAAATTSSNAAAVVAGSVKAGSLTGVLGALVLGVLGL